MRKRDFEEKTREKRMTKLWWEIAGNNSEEKMRRKSGGKGRREARKWWWWGGKGDGEIYEGEGKRGGRLQWRRGLRRKKMLKNTENKEKQKQCIKCTCYLKYVTGRSNFYS